MKKTTIKIEGNEEIEVKRFYLPIRYKFKCSNCGADNEIDLSSDYLSYPRLNTSESFGTYCNECDTDGELKLTLKMEVDIEEEKEEEEEVTDISKVYSYEDIKEAFEAGDKFRLYLDKNAVGLAEDDIPSVVEILETMNFNSWIKNKDNEKAD